MAPGGWATKCEKLLNLEAVHPPTVPACFLLLQATLDTAAQQEGLISELQKQLAAAREEIAQAQAAGKGGQMQRLLAGPKYVCVCTQANALPACVTLRH